MDRRSSSLGAVKIPRDLFKGLDTERIRKLNEDENSFVEFLGGLKLEDVS